MVVVLLMVFGAVSVSFGAWISEENEANYQKLKAEVEEYGGGEGCKWSEDGKKVISGGRICEFQNIIAFFDEIRVMEVKTKKEFDSPFDIALKKVREMPRFKNDSRIYTQAKGAYFKEQAFWEIVWYDWERAKGSMRIDGARRGYWKKLAE